MEMCKTFFAYSKKVLKKICQNWDRITVVVLILCMAAGLYWSACRSMSPEEAILRRSLADTAQTYLGYSEEDGSYLPILDLYNSYEPSPRGYTITDGDNWCAAFGSAMALKAGLTHIIPMECSCEQQIRLFAELNCWQEDEQYLPETGDYIYYVWDEWRKGDCTAWAGHVGIVADTFGPVIKVIEGNKDDQVSFRYVFLNDITIRGFGRPDFATAANE